MLGGATHIGWIQSAEFHVATSTTPGAWVTADTVPTPNAIAGHPSLAAIGSTLHAAWQQGTPGVRTINAARAEGQETTRVSVDSEEAQANAESAEAEVSADGRFVAFGSTASNLVPGDGNGAFDIFVRDRQAGTTERVSRGMGGTEADGDSPRPAISADGRYVAFESSATNLVAGDTNGVPDIFVFDRQTATTERVSVATDGAQTTGPVNSFRPAISADGRFVAFQSDATNLITGDTNDALDIFVHDRDTDVTSRVSVGAGGVPADANSSRGSLSADGRLVSFTSSASNLVSGDTNGQLDVFVRDRQTGVTERVSVATAGTQGDGSAGTSVISDDGRYVAFDSAARDLVAGDTNGASDVFLHDRQSASTARVSVSATGAQLAGESSAPSISADGRLVAFQSLAEGVVPGDSNGWIDVFVRDRQASTTERISMGPGVLEPNSHSVDPAVSADGSYVAFRSVASNLVPADTNDAVDIFGRERDVSPPPAAPSVTGVAPASGANDNSPKITGTAAAGTTVRLYDNAACSGTALATGTAAEFAAPGLVIAVADNSTTTVFATATNADGTSACSTSSVTYREVTTTVRFASAAATVQESAGTVSLVVERVGDTTGQTTVSYATADGTAGAPGDYGATSATVTFAPGQTQRTVSVAIVDDALEEQAESFAVTLSAPTGGAALGVPATTTVTIAANDEVARTLRFAAATASVPEQSGPAVLTVQRTGSPSGAVSVKFNTESGTAGVLSDFLFTDGTLTFADGETSKTISVPIVDDSAVDPGETFRVLLSAPTGNAALGTPSEATVTIADNEVIDTRITSSPDSPSSDAMPAFSFEAVPAQAGATFECWFDAGTPAPCSSPFTPATALSEGEHTFRVRATSAGGQTDPTPATAGLMIDTVAPAVTLRLVGSQLAGGSYRAPVGVAVDAVDPAPATGVAEQRCVVDPPSVAATFGALRRGPCELVTQPGLHTAYAAAIDVAGNASVPVSVTFRIAEPPDTQINSGPEGVSYNTTPRFTFQSNVATATFVCGFDGAAPQPCATPFVPLPLAPGTHVFEVAAVSAEGVADPTPARRSFTVAGAETRTLGCSVLLPRAEDQPISSTGLYPTERFGGGYGANGCNVELGACPEGAKCTVRAAATLRIADLTRRYLSADPIPDFIIAWTASNNVRFDPPRAGDSGSCIIFNTAGEQSCKPTPAQRSLIGTGQTMVASCAARHSGYSGDSNTAWGPDASRRVDCEVTVRIEPVATLDATVGARTAVVFVPGAGTLRIAAARSASGSAARAAKRSPAFKPVRRVVESAGPVTVPLRLSRMAKRKLARSGRLPLGLRRTFTPAGGSPVTRTTRVVLLAPVREPSTTQLMRQRCRADRSLRDLPICKRLRA